MWHLVRLTDFGHPACKRVAYGAVSRAIFRGQAVQEFLVTPTEAQILHRGRV